jgi:hypothetical protein
MSYAPLCQDFVPDIEASEVHNANPPAEGSFWQRLFHAVIDARLRQQDRRMAQFIQRHGGRLTDDIERQLMSHATGSVNSWQRQW